jgi:hypothetical protein
VIRPSRFGTQAGALLVFLGGAAAAQGVDPLSKLDPNSRYQVDLLLDSAKVLGLPAKCLRGRALEGVAKNVDSREIVKKVRQQFNALRDARAALGNVTEDELCSAGVIIEAGLKPDQLAPFKNPPRGRSLLSAFMVLGDLVTRGVPRDEASSAIGKLWQGGAGDGDFMGLFKGVQSDILQGLSPGTALQIRMREMPGRAPPTSKPTPPSGQPETPSSK